MLPVIVLYLHVQVWECGDGPRGGRISLALGAQAKTRGVDFDHTHHGAAPIVQVGVNDAPAKGDTDHARPKIVLYFWYMSHNVTYFLRGNVAAL